MNRITRAAVKADKAIPSDRKATALAFLDGRGDALLPRLLVTQAEAARMLGVSRITVYRLAQDGKLPVVAVRGAKRYRVSDLEGLAR